MHCSVRRLTFLHCPEHFVPTPLWKSPVIVILLDSTNANGAITSTAATNEFTSRNMALPTVEASIWSGHEIPVCLALVILSPAVQASDQTHKSRFLTYAPAMCMLSISALSLPASSRRILRSESSERRPAMTGPHVPPLERSVSGCTRSLVSSDLPTYHIVVCRVVIGHCQIGSCCY